MQEYKPKQLDSSACSVEIVAQTSKSAVSQVSKPAGAVVDDEF